MLSQTVEYALRASVCLASEPHRRWTVDELAEATLVPVAYLGKVLQQLVRGRIVASRRGIGGGFELASSPSDVNVLDIVEAVDPIRRIRHCPLGLAAHGSRLCPLHRRLDDALASVEAAFATATLATILDEPSSSIPLCAFPPTAGGCHDTTTQLPTGADQ
jgi:Rrf2 family transcriptional regulator, nitric oxide-sensitive transcriptional repressor